MDKNTLHEIGNYLHQIISNAEYIDDKSEYADKIKRAAYKIDALITDTQTLKPTIKLEQEKIATVDFTKFVGIDILIVDDVMENIQIMRNIFSTLSCNIKSAMSGEEAIEIFKDGYKPKIVCMDMIMPGMDGSETTRELKLLGCDSYFIAISALKNQPHDVVSIFDVWLPKPFTIEHITGALAGYNSSKNIVHIEKDYTLKTLSKEIQQKLLKESQNGAYSKLKRLISSLDESEDKEFLTKELKRINFRAIVKSIVSS